MEVMRKCMVFLITLINFKWLKDVKDYADCLPAKDREDINNSFKDFFGAENVPRPSLFSSIGRDTSSAKKYMMNLYKFTTENGKQKLDDNDLVNQTVVEKADTVVSFVNHAYPPRPNASDEDGAMFFDVQTLSNFAIESTLQSDLRIFLNVSKKRVRDSSLKITIYQIVIPKRKYYRITSRVIDAYESDWHDFDILGASQSWKEDETTNNGVLVICQTSDNRARTMRECGLIDFKGDSETRPFLVSFHQSGDEEEILAEQVPQDEEETEVYSHRRFQIPDRMRRSLASLHSLFPDAPKSTYSGLQTEHPSNSTCSRHNLEIRFKDLGWSDWIIAPEKYEAAYCGGDCPFPLNDNMNATNHAIIQTLVHLIAPSELPQPCCAPKDLQELQVLFLDEYNNIVMKRYANMVVTNCGCQ